MVYSKTFAKNDDLKLSSTAMNAIILLYHTFPDKFGKYWVTASEMRERLVRCGVDSSLQMDDVNNATRSHNKHGLLEKRNYQSTAFFRPSKFRMESPKEQRINGNIIPMPKKNLFHQVAAAQQLLKKLNTELERVKKLKKDVESGEICCELFVLKFYPFLILLICNSNIRLKCGSSQSIFSGERCSNIDRYVCRLQL